MDNTYIVIGLIVLLVAGLFLVGSAQVEGYIRQWRFAYKWFGKKGAILYFIVPPLITLFILALAFIMMRINGYRF
jgi:hypothetical protein